MTTIDKLKLLSLSTELDPAEVQTLFPEAIEHVQNPSGGTNLRVKDLDIVLLKAILELDARLTQAGV